MQACLDRCRSAIFEIMVIGPLRIERQGAGSKTGCNHVGEDGARLGEVEGASAGSIAVYPRSSRRRRSSALIAQISLSISRILRKLSINSATCTCTPLGT